MSASKNQVVCFGEALIDMLALPQASTDDARTFAQYAGGGAAPPPPALNARWRMRLMGMDGKVLSKREQKATVKPLSSLQVGNFSDKQLLGSADPKKTYAVFQLLDGDTLLSREVVFFAPAKQLALPTAKIDSQWRADGDGYALTLTSNTLAREVWLSFGDLEVKVSDNAFDLLPGEPLTLHVSSKLPLAQVQSALQVRDLGSTLAGAPPEPPEAAAAK
ncbi:hypothetical protein XVE_4856 [Xanthomonas vesicatoria ATCC 35937]|uniref:Uncharacterized protein n=1 Tax=Xanthomonas vesicatoria ATCC 35937 TaxID=925775 RepID=F0BKP1_9XANT|nr:hypothetical protein XVE_4856 [Xanthomonas vesicatoria ATCC 35937]